MDKYLLLLALIVYAIITLVEAKIDHEVTSDTPSTTSMDECQGYCDRLSGYFCLEFFGICQPCIEAECMATDKSFCPPICEEYFKGQLPTSSSTPRRTSSKGFDTASPNHPGDMLTTTPSFHHPPRPSNQFNDERTQKDLLLLSICITFTVIIIIIIIVFIREYIIPGTISFLIGGRRGRERGRGSRGDGFQEMSPESEMKVGAKLANNPSVYVALPVQSTNKLF